MKQYTKKSTDNIEFYPSLGFITRDLPTMEKAIRATLELPQPKEPIVIHAPQGLVDSLPEASRRTLVDAGLAIEAVAMPEFGNERQPMIEFLTKEIAACDVFLGFDAKVDFYGLGRHSALATLTPKWRRCKTRAARRCFAWPTWSRRAP